MIDLKENEVKAILHNMGLDASLEDCYSKVDGLSLQNLFFCKNHYFPYCDMFTQEREDAECTFDTEGLLAELRNVYKDLTYHTVIYRNINLSKNETEIGFSIIIPDKNIFARFEKAISESYILYGDGDGNALKDFEEIVVKFYIQPKVKPNNIRVIRAVQGGFDLSDFEVDDIENFSLEDEYNDDFKKEAEKIYKFIDAEKSGIVILHGEKGTGKSTFINQLILDKPEKSFIYFPSSLVPLLGEPTFTDFLPRLKGCVLILEDCEDALRSRNELGTNSPVNQLLNLADGLLKSLKVKFICTFNAEVSTIDPALLRKGRLISKYEFKKLNKDKATKLLRELYEDDSLEAKEDMSLADIYNYNDDSYEEIKKVIGFNR